MKLLQAAINLFSSYGFAATMILFMLALTFFGTLEQVDHGLLEVQRKYFESTFLIHWVGPVPVPLPGGYLVMILLSINLVIGGLIRLKKNWRRPGVLIVHIGMVVMMVAGFVTFQYSQRGFMRLYETQTSDRVLSFTDWAIEIGEPGTDKANMIVPQRELEDLEGDRARTFYSGSLPFDLTVSGYAHNSFPVKAGPMVAESPGVVDGYVLETLKLDPQAENNIAGAHATITDKATGEKTEAILWGMANYPLTVASDGKTYTLDLTKETMIIPFALKLDKFTRVLHPGTDRPASFESEVTKLEGESKESILIFMNNPLRHEGWTFFQQSFGPNAPALTGAPGEFFTVFEVVRNPADHWPLYSCIVISAGLLIHFTQKLLKYIQAENKRRPA